MHCLLTSHPSSPVAAVAGVDVDVDVERRPQGLTARFAVRGDVKALLLPAPAAPARKDELWRHTCFEAFLQAEGASGYLEFNFSPSTEWAAYRFAGYRAGMAPLNVPTPRIEVHAGDALLVVEAALSLDGVDLAAGERRLGLAAVIEEKDGRRSFWALKHPAGQPDFHHADCFALRLPAASAS